MGRLLGGGRAPEGSPRRRTAGDAVQGGGDLRRELGQRRHHRVRDARNGGLWRVSAAGGAPEALTTLQPGEYSHRLPHMLPGGRAVIFTISKGAKPWDDTQIVVRSLATGQQTVLVTGGADGRYVSTGHLVYVRLGTLMAVPFDARRLVVTGDARGLVDGVMQAANRDLSDMDNTLAAQFTVSETGALVYVDGWCHACAESHAGVGGSAGHEPGAPCAAAPVSQATRVARRPARGRLHPGGYRSDVELRHRARRAQRGDRRRAKRLRHFFAGRETDRLPIRRGGGRGQPLLEGRRRQRGRGTPHDECAQPDTRLVVARRVDARSLSKRETPRPSSSFSSTSGRCRSRIARLVR